MEEESVWIGPSRCDEQRSAREKDIERIWNELASTRGFRETYLLLAPAIDLFREALSCYQNGAYMATVLMCRACIETSIYLLTTRRRIKWREDLEMVQEVKVDYDLIRAEWKCILCRAKSDGYINDEIERELREIREFGNFVAHYGQRFDKEIVRKIEDRRVGEVKGWIKREDSLQTLHRTANVLKVLMGKTFDKCNLNKAI
jgi:hypothetical protein